MDENTGNKDTELNNSKVTNVQNADYQFEVTDASSENAVQEKKINRILAQQQRKPSDIVAPSTPQNNTQNAQNKPEEKSKPDLSNVIVKNFSPTGFYDEKKKDDSSTDFFGEDSSDFTYGHNVLESSSLVDGGFRPTTELKEKPFVSPQKKMKSQEVALLMAIIAMMVVSILFFGVRALNTKPKKEEVTEKPFKNRPVASDEINIYTSSEKVAGFKESEFDQLFYEAYFKGIDGRLKVPRKEYVFYQQIDDSYFEIDINPEKWFFAKNIEEVSDTGTMLFVLATDYKFNEINIRTVSHETAENFADQENAEVYTVNGWTFVYAEDKSVLGYYPLTDETDFCYYFANSYLSENALYNFFDCLTTNVNISEIDEDEYKYQYVDMYPDLDKKPSNRTNIQLNNLIILQTYNENTHIESWISEPAYNVVTMQINNLPDFTFKIYELDDPLTDSNIADFGIATVEEVAYRSFIYYRTKDATGKTLGIYIPDSQNDTGNKQCYIEIDTDVQDYDFDALLTVLLEDIITIK